MILRALPEGFSALFLRCFCGSGAFDRIKTLMALCFFDFASLFLPPVFSEGFEGLEDFKGFSLTRRRIDKSV